ncbi:histidine kinase [Paenibacillus sp. GCM10027626]|uniref:sensor histidine kinase n=1 Tax=Paenibacillus sp. GCM10027626 TaxID=3273411 RepID=UPI00363F0BF6
MTAIKVFLLRNRNKSIFGRLVLTFLLIISPLYVLSIEMYRWAIETQKQDISHTMLSQVNFYVESLEKEIQRIKLLLYYATDDINLQQLANVPESLDDFDKSVSILQLQQRLLAIASSSSYIKNTSAYIVSLDRVVSSGTYKSSIPDEEFRILDLNSRHSPEAQTVYWQNRLFMSVSSLASTFLESKDVVRKHASFILSVEFDLHALEQALKQFNDYSDGGAVMIDLKNGLQLFSASNKEQNEKMAELVNEAVLTEKNGSMVNEIKDKSYWSAYTSSDYLGIALAKYIPEQGVLTHLQRYFNWFWVFTVTSVLLIVLYSLFTYRLIYKPLSTLVKSFRKVEKGDLNFSITHKTRDEFRYLYTAFNQMMARLAALIQQVYQQKILTQNAQLKQLQTQIVPHFLYNSYFILHRMVIDEDQENAARFSLLLGRYLKFITRNAGEEVALDKEIDHARIYTEIMSMRFASRMSLEFGTPPDECRLIRVPRLILQPIVENAIVHGIERKAAGGILSVSFLRAEEALGIIVEDNGTRVSDEELDRMQQSLIEKAGFDEVETTGIQNIHRRLQYRFGGRSGLSFSRSELGGLKAVIRIPWKEGRQHDVQIVDRG